MTVKELSAALSLTEFALPAPDAPVTGGYAGRPAQLGHGPGHCRGLLDHHSCPH